MKDALFVDSRERTAYRWSLFDHSQIALDAVTVKWKCKCLFPPMQTCQMLAVRRFVHYVMDVLNATKVMKILVLRHQVPFCEGHER
jgi:hypothetical protein